MKSVQGRAKRLSRYLERRPEKSLLLVARQRDWRTPAAGLSVLFTIVVMNTIIIIVIFVVY